MSPGDLTLTVEDEESDIQLTLDTPAEILVLGLTDSPGGPAGGDLGGNYPNPFVEQATPNFRALNGISVEDGFLYMYGGGAFAMFANKVDTRTLFYIAPSNGALNWGPGGTDDTDTNLFREAAEYLRTNASLLVGGELDINYGTPNQVTISKGGIIFFGSGLDTNLYRAAASTLKTDSSFMASSFIVPTGGSLQSQGYLQLISGAPNDQILFKNSAAVELMRVNLDGSLVMGPSRRIGWSAADGTGILDTSLYRANAGTVATDGAFSVGGNAFVSGSFYTNGAVSSSGGNFYLKAGTLYFGSADDTNLYRSAANMLQTDGSFKLGGNIYAMGAVYLGSGSDAYIFRVAGNIVGTIGSFQSQGALAGWGFSTLATGDTFPRSYLRNDSRLLFGPGNVDLDTSLYRTAAGVLQTDGTLTVLGSLNTGTFVNMPAGGYLNIGPDTQLYRYGASYLATNGHFLAGGSLFVDHLGSGFPIYFGAAADANLYRAGANSLKTDGDFAAAGYIAADGNIYADNDNPSGKIILGGGIITIGPDTNLYRSAASTLKTDSAFYAPVVVVNNGGGLNSLGYLILSSGATNDQIMFQASTGERARFNINGDFVLGPSRRIGWSASPATGTYDTSLYRYAAQYLATDGTLVVGNNIFGGNISGTFNLYSSQGTAGTDRVLALSTRDSGETLRQIITLTGNKLGFFGAAPIPKPIVSGTKSGIPALGSLISLLAQYGLIIDNTT